MHVILFQFLKFSDMYNQIKITAARISSEKVEL